MNTDDIIRSWTDRDSRDLKNTDEAPDHPAGTVEVDDDALIGIAGGCGIMTTFVSSCVPPGYHCP